MASAHPGYGWLAEEGSRAVPPEWHGWWACRLTVNLDFSGCKLRRDIPSPTTRRQQLGTQNPKKNKGWCVTRGDFLDRKKNHQEEIFPDFFGKRGGEFFVAKWCWGGMPARLDFLRYTYTSCARTPVFDVFQKLIYVMLKSQTKNVILTPAFIIPFIEILNVMSLTHGLFDERSSFLLSLKIGGS